MVLLTCSHYVSARYYVEFLMAYEKAAGGKNRIFLPGIIKKCKFVKFKFVKYFVNRMWLAVGTNNF